MIKQLLNSVITKYRDLPVSCRSIICLSLRLRQIIDMLATDKSRYFAQPRPIIVKHMLYNKSVIPNSIWLKRIITSMFFVLIPFLKQLCVSSSILRRMQRREEEYWCQSYFPTWSIHLFVRFRYRYRFRFHISWFSFGFFNNNNLMPRVLSTWFYKMAPV